MDRYRGRAPRRDLERFIRRWPRRLLGADVRRGREAQDTGALHLAQSLVNESNNQAQVDLACNCFVDDFHKKYGDRPVQEIKARLEEGEQIRESAEALMLKCAYAAGLN
jgi:hypothetical protein